MDEQRSAPHRRRDELERPVVVVWQSCRTRDTLRVETVGRRLVRFRERDFDVAVNLIEHGRLAAQVVVERRRFGEVGSRRFRRRSQAVPRLQLRVAPAGVEATANDQGDDDRDGHESEAYQPDPDVETRCGAEAARSWMASSCESVVSILPAWRMVVSFLTRWRGGLPARMAARVGLLTKALLPARGILVALFAMPIVIGGAPAPSWPPATLRDTGLYSDWATKTIARDNLPFSPQYPLWSDGAKKSRWVRIPKGAYIDASNPDVWRFPVGTRLWKEFRFATPRRDALHRAHARRMAVRQLPLERRRDRGAGGAGAGRQERADSRGPLSPDPVANRLPRLSRSRPGARAGHHGLADVARSRSERAARRAAGPWLARPHEPRRAGDRARTAAPHRQHAAANRGFYAHGARGARLPEHELRQLPHRRRRAGVAGLRAELHDQPGRRRAAAGATDRGGEAEPLQGLVGSRTSSSACARGIRRRAWSWRAWRRDIRCCRCRRSARSWWTRKRWR